MKTHRWIFLLMIGLLIAGCQSTALSPASALPQGAQAATAAPAKTQGASPQTNPANPTAGNQNPNAMNTTPSSANPSSQSAGSGSDPWSAYPPAADDSGLVRGNFFIDSVAIQPVAGKPGQFDLNISGSLPTPCNQPRAKVNPPDAQKNIVVDLYTLTDPSRMCTQVIKPFEGKVATFKDLPAGKYTVVVNDQPAVEMTVP